MERKLVTLQFVDSVEPIKDADFIERIKVLGWTLVASKGDFKPGDMCVFFEIDSVLPETNPDFAFMEKHKFRVRTMKLRGVVSQGLAMPISILDSSDFLYSPKVGEDMTKVLGVEKYEPPAKLRGLVRGSFPFYVPKTDEIRIQSIPEVLDELKGESIVITLKVDGTSMTAVSKDGEFHVCSRNLSMKEEEDSVYWRMANKYLLKEITEIEGIAIQGEIVGPGIQKNRLGLKTHDFLVFNVYNVERQSYLNHHDTALFCLINNLKQVPLVQYVPEFNYSQEELLELAKGKYADTDNNREGIVVRPLAEMHSEILRGRLSFKVINNDYLLKGGD